MDSCLNLICCCLLFILTAVSLVEGRTISGTFSSLKAARERGQYLTSFCFHSGDGTIHYQFNATTKTQGFVYLFVDEDWEEAQETEKCESKLEMARLVYNLSASSVEGNLSVHPFTRARRWHILMGDSFSCSNPGSWDPEQDSFIHYTLKLLNPDSLHNPTDHCSCEELGLLRFFQLVTLVYFLCGCIGSPKIWEALQKQGPMHILLILLNLVTFTQGLSALLTTLALREYSIDGLSSPWLEFFAQILNQGSQCLMLLLLLSLSMGREIAGVALDLRHHLIKLSSKPTTKIVALLGACQAVVIIYTSLFSHRDLQYPLDPSLPSLLLLGARAILSIAVAMRLQTFVGAERSVLKRHFYTSFTKNCLLWFLCYPAFFLLSLMFSVYFRHKLICFGVVICQCLAGILQYRLLISRSLYWEVSSLSSYLPLRMDKSFGTRLYS